MVKFVASASVFVAAGTAAIVFGVAHVQHEQKLTVGAVAATMSAPQGTRAVRSDTLPVAGETSPAHAATQAPTALAAIQANPADMAAELAGPPEAAGQDRSSPSFDIVRVETSGDAVIAGRAAPGATVDLLRGGERLAQAVADSSGEFVMVPPRLPAGSYELTLSAKLPDGTITSSKHGAAVAVNDAGPSARAAQSLAEYVPETASQQHPSSEPPLQKTGQPQENADLQPVHALHASSVSSPAVAHAISSKVVSRGDSLWRISRIIYGDGSRYALVYRANRERIRTPNLIYPGQTLVLPPRHN
ncbi:LysM peptidoglycan-binding domain-containing protein [Bradyrhizobium sp.]|uniref:LysM peptidoglycan-binding domain-containing protein n=1 Tax=Bradyrhizobium sp. TaxID=376 RepID=UPI002631609A|nr:LysM peptidoglycan-binding domain-containing protein [Bradyrhizobium sp.]